MSAVKYVFPKTLKELRFQLSQTSPSSAHLRTVLSKWYPALRKNNPGVPILIRETTAAEPIAFARFELGKETKVHLNQQQSAAEVEKAIQSLIESK